MPLAGRILERISDLGQPLGNRDLRALTDLTSELETGLIALWPTIDLARRREITRRLADICQSDFVVDFTPVALIAIQDDDSLVRLAALDILWDAESPSLVNPLLELLLTDPNPAVQAAAAQVLGHFVMLGELGKLSDEVAERLIATLLDVAKDMVRAPLVCARALEAVAPASMQGVNELIAQAYRSQQETLRISAVTAMGQSADPKWEPIILAELESASPGMRYSAAGAAGKLELDAAIQCLIELLDDPDPNVIAASVRSLGEIGGSEAREALQSLQDDKELGAAASEAMELIDLADGALPHRYHDHDPWEAL